MEERMRENDEIEIDLGEILHLLLRRIWIILLSFIVGAGLVGGITKFLITPQYSASSMIYILSKTTSITSVADIQMGAQLTVDFETLAGSRPVIEAVIDDLDLNLDYEELLKKITITNPESTQILKMTVEDEDPKLARDISNSLSEATADRVAEVMVTDKPSIVEEAVTPKEPSSPSLVKNTAIGALLGAFLAIAIIIVRHLLDDTIKTDDDVRKYLTLNTLASVPLEKGAKTNTGGPTKKHRKSA